MPAETTRWTAESARALPGDGNRYEVLDGELFVTPAPARLHQRALLALIRVLDPYVSTYRLDERRRRRHQDQHVPRPNIRLNLAR